MSALRSFSSIVLSRFFLSLREVSGNVEGTTSSTAPPMSSSSLHFTQGIGAFGGSFPAMWYDGDDDDAPRHDEGAYDDQPGSSDSAAPDDTTMNIGSEAYMG